MILPSPKSDFIGLDDKVHLATGGEPPLLVTHRNAFETFANDKASGMKGYSRHWDVVDEVREQIAFLFGLTREDIGLIGNTSEGIIKVLASVNWDERDNVVISELDYASGRYAFGRLTSFGVDVRVVPSTNFRIDCKQILNFCDNRTRAVYISQVNALTGQYIDITPLSINFKDKRTILLLDASHAFGVAPVQASLADFTVSACYKFALGIHEGIFAWNQARQPEFEPLGVGWAAAVPGEAPEEFLLKKGAQRVEYGNAGHLGAYLLRESLLYLEKYGAESVCKHARAAVLRLTEGFSANKLDVMTPMDAGEFAGNAAFACSNPKEIVTKAEADKVYIWGDNNRIRVSAHLFTTHADIDYFLERLPTYLL